MSSIPSDHHQYNTEEQDEWGITMLYEWERGKKEGRQQALAEVLEKVSKVIQDHKSELEYMRRDGGFHRSDISHQHKIITGMERIFSHLEKWYPDAT